MQFNWICRLSLIVFCCVSLDVQADELDQLPDDISLDDVQTGPVIKDKFETFNRRIFTFNKGVDKILITPAGEIYGKVTMSEKVRTRVNNFINNLKGPSFMINNLLYGNPAGFFKNGARFLINSTVGLAGTCDIASKLGVEKDEKTFADVMAQKLYIKNGQYLILPALGPSTQRNAAGMVVDRLLLDPFTFLFPTSLTAGLLGVEIISIKYEKKDLLDQISQSSVDEYAMLRSLYAQSSYAKEFTREKK